jgi:molybdate transport system substrate-binding protein
MTGGQNTMQLRLLAATVALAGIPLPAQVRVLASNGMKAVLEDLRPQCERTSGSAGSGITMNIEYATSASLKKRIDGGEAFDLAILTTDLIDQLIQTGKLSAGTRINLGRSGIGVGIRAGAPKPNIRTAEAFKRTLLTAKGVTYAHDGASRVYIERMFQRLGIADAMGPKVILEEGSTRATARVASGDAELVLTLVSEILPAPGVELLGPIPGEFQNYVGFAAGASSKSANAAVASGTIKCFSGPAVAPVLRAKGMEPTK